MNEHRPHSVMLLSRPYEPDVRPQKQAHTLAAAGWKVSIVAWDRDCRHPLHMHETAPDFLAQVLATWPHRVESMGQVTIRHIPLRAGYITGRRLLRTLPRFWWRTWHELRRLRPDVVHANDLDTLPVAILYRYLTGVPVIFDVHDYYPGMVRGSVGASFSRALELLERILVPLVDRVFTVGEAAAQRYRRSSAKVHVIENVQPLPDRGALQVRRRALRQHWGVPDDALLMTYVGYLNPERVLQPLLDAVSRMDNVWLVIGGTGPQAEVVQAAAASCDRILALGWVPLDQVPVVVAAGDAVYYGFDARNANSAYFMPNLGYFSLAVGRPIVTTPVGGIAALVQREQCGIVLDAPTCSAIQAALDQLCDVAYRDILTNYAQAAGRQRYHWLMAADVLLAAYRDLQ